MDVKGEKSSYNFFNKSKLRDQSVSREKLFSIFSHRVSCPFNSSYIWDSSFIFTQRFFWQMSPSFFFFANNSKTAGRRKLMFLYNVGIHQS